MSTVANATIDELTVNYEENGQLVVKELDKAILTRGAWTTIIFRFQEWKNDSDTYGPDKYVIRRYKKSGGEFRMQSKFNISNKEQAKKIIEALQGWMEEDDTAAE